MNKAISVIILFTLLSMAFPVQEVQSANDSTYQTIPDEAIRLRILANSDSEHDQRIKRLVRDEVNGYISELVQSVDNITEARSMIRHHLPVIREIVANTLEVSGSMDTFQVDYRSDVTFPTKIYDKYIYPAGQYEAVLISIGNGEGANWWCVLFPPLCFLDFSNGSIVDETDGQGESDESEERMEEMEIENTDHEDQEAEEEVEVTFFLFDWLGLS